MNYANWGTRAGACIIDALVTVPLILLALLDRPVVDATTNETSGGGVLYWGLTVAAFVLNGYNRWYLAGKTGQSWGKRVLGTSLVGAATQQPIGALKAFLRDLAHIIDTIICYIGWLFPIWDAKRQTIADKIVSTVVVKS